MLKRPIILALVAGTVLVSSAFGARVTDGLVVGYDFREGSGPTVHDYSGNGEPLDLTIHDPGAVTWNAEGSITITDSTIISSASDANVPSEGTATKIFDAITESEEITLEAWIAADSYIDNAGPARVMTMSFDPTNRNFTLGQNEDSWQARFRTTTTGNNGYVRRRETDFDTVELEVQHVVYVRFPPEDAYIYIDGEEAPLDPANESSGPIDGNTSNWNDTYDFALGNELTWDDIEARDWLGTMYLIAVYDRALSADEIRSNFEAGALAPVTGDGSPLLQAGDADMDLDFDQLDLVQVQIAAKYLTGQAATWGEGDWDGAPGGSAGNPPPGNGTFDQLDIIAALAAGTYLTGPYGAVSTGGVPGDDQTSVGYNVTTGEVWVDPPAGQQLTSINIDSASGIFTGDPAANLGGSFDNDADNNIFKATFGSSFGAVSFGNVAQPGLSEDEVVNDLTVVGSLQGGGGLGDVDLVYIPEPSAVVLLLLGGLGVLCARPRQRPCPTTPRSTLTQ